MLKKLLAESPWMQSRVPDWQASKEPIIVSINGPNASHLGSLIADMLRNYMVPVQTSLGFNDPHAEFSGTDVLESLKRHSGPVVIHVTS